MGLTADFQLIIYMYIQCLLQQFHVFQKHFDIISFNVSYAFFPEHRQSVNNPLKSSAINSLLKLSFTHTFTLWSSSLKWMAGQRPVSYHHPWQCKILCSELYLPSMANQTVLYPDRPNECTLFSQNGQNSSPIKSQ